MNLIQLWCGIACSQTGGRRWKKMRGVKSCSCGVPGKQLCSGTAMRRWVNQLEAERGDTTPKGKATHARIPLKVITWFRYKVIINRSLLNSAQVHEHKNKNASYNKLALMGFVGYRRLKIIVG